MLRVVEQKPVEVGSSIPAESQSTRPASAISDRFKRLLSSWMEPAADPNYSSHIIGQKRGFYSICNFKQPTFRFEIPGSRKPSRSDVDSNLIWAGGHWLRAA